MVRGYEDQPMLEAPSRQAPGLAPPGFLKFLNGWYCMALVCICVECFIDRARIHEYMDHCTILRGIM